MSVPIADQLTDHEPSLSRVDPVPAQAAAPRRGEYHRLPLLARHRRFWWRPLVALAVFGGSYVAMLIVAMVPLLILGLLVPGLAPSEELSDARNPMDMLLMLGLTAVMIPATLLASRLAYGRARIVHSVAGRLRWGLMGRAALVVVPLYLLMNIGGTLVGEWGAFEVPAPSAGVVAAFAIIVLLVPLQAAAEEYAFRALPMQALGTWLRSPLWGIFLPVPLFVVLHGYDRVGQIDVAVFAIAAGLLAWKTGGLELPILVHVANNWTLFILTPALPGALEQGAVPPVALLTSTLPTVILTAGLWWWYSRREGLSIMEPRTAQDA